MEMAEKFLALVPQHDRIKFAKNGSTVVTAAVKLARAYTGKKYVAFPIDHPFYSYDDWFIGKTNCNKGVPIEIQGLTLNYISTDLDTLKKIFEEYPNQIACVVSEPEKQLEVEQSESYLKELIDLVHKHGALFIQDEMVTGFKTDYPGSIKKFNVEPDLATWGKGIANGFSFCALTGKKEIMDLGGIKNIGSERVFLTSTTHGGETHAMVAAMATLDEYQDKQVIKHMHEKGNLFLNEINSIVESHKMNDFITVYNYPWTPVVGFKDTEFKYCQGFRTLFLQEMIKRGVLFQGALVPSFSHSHEDILYIAAAFNESLIIYKKALEDGYANYLVGEPCKPVFRKFN
jgi:glutamate-1-semialdehyde aminotransferase